MFTSGARPHGPNVNPILSEWRMNFGDESEWETTMEFWYATVSALYGLIPSEVPAEWQFLPGAAGLEFDSYPVSAVVSYLGLTANKKPQGAGDELSAIGSPDPTYALEALLHAGKVITRYANLLKSLEKDTY